MKTTPLDLIHTISTIYEGPRVVMSTVQTEYAGFETSESSGCMATPSEFVVSDSSPVRGRASRATLSLGLRFLGGYYHFPIVSCRTGSNNQNTSRVQEADLQDQASRLLKADGARSMTPKRSRQFARTTSGLAELCLE